jgi:hypothetical protein
VQSISWRCPAERLARAGVQLGCYRIKVLTRVDRKVGALGKVLPEQAVGVFVRSVVGAMVRACRRSSRSGTSCPARACFAGVRVVPGAAAGPPRQLGVQGGAVVDFLRPRARDVQQESVQRPAYERGVRLVRQRAGVGVVVVVAFSELQARD